MVDQALGSKLQPRAWMRVWGLRAVPAALVVAVVLGAFTFGVNALAGHDLDSGEVKIALWALFAALALVYGLARIVLGANIVDRLMSRVVDWFRPSAD